jgi:hypothetical protein
VPLQGIAEASSRGRRPPVRNDDHEARNEFTRGCPASGSASRMPPMAGRRRRPIVRGCRSRGEVRNPFLARKEMSQMMRKQIGTQELAADQHAPRDLAKPQ